MTNFKIKIFRHGGVIDVRIICYETDLALIARFMGPTWGLPGANRTQVGPMLAT